MKYRGYEIYEFSSCCYYVNAVSGYLWWKIKKYIGMGRTLDEAKEMAQEHAKQNHKKVYYLDKDGYTEW